MAYQSPSIWAPTLVVAGAIVAAGFVVKGSLDKTTAGLEGIQSGLADTQKALSEVAAAQTAAAPAPRRRGPDPDKRYTLKTAGRPAKGPSKTKVEIVEFSDFQ
jgi:protein-disulfide isomerase